MIFRFMGEIVNNAMMMGAIHWYFQVVQPLYFQIFLGIFRIWDWSMFRIHVLSESEEDFPLLKRPFPLPPNPLKDLMEQVLMFFFFCLGGFLCRFSKSPFCSLWDHNKRNSLREDLLLLLLVVVVVMPLEWRFWKMMLTTTLLKIKRISDYICSNQHNKAAMWVGLVVFFLSFTTVLCQVNVIMAGRTDTNPAGEAESLFYSSSGTSGSFIAINGTSDLPGNKRTAMVVFSPELNLWVAAGGRDVFDQCETSGLCITYSLDGMTWHTATGLPTSWGGALGVAWGYHPVCFCFFFFAFFLSHTCGKRGEVLVSLLLRRDVTPWALRDLLLGATMG